MFGRDRKKIKWKEQTSNKQFEIQQTTKAVQLLDQHNKYYIRLQDISTNIEKEAEERKETSFGAFFTITLN